LTGISDGGSGVYYLAMRAATPWAACLPINGHPLVLANREAAVSGTLFLGNLVNCPLYIINGDRDPLYPSAGVAPLVEAMRLAGAEPVFRPIPDGRHNTEWWPSERAAYEKFVAGHPRQAHPARVSWETDNPRRDNRFRWLVVDGVGLPRPSDSTLEDVNTFTPRAGVSWAIFPRRPRAVSSRVDVTRDGNVFDATTRGVTRFTLLLSPDAIDFAQPVRVNVNGAVAFDGRVERDVATLLAWAARDNDRTMLYGAELKITVP
jgi:pimeloyl-ACP methyl ester carboxylesterase